MMAHELDEVRRVTDDELLSRLERLVKADRDLSVKLLVHLGEVEVRKLFLERGYSSMYDYCMTALGMSEAETYLRLLAAKTGKRLPLVLERLAEGGLHLTAIKLLAPLLTEQNHVALLDRARGMSKRQLEVLVAELAPKADVPERLRRLPEVRGASAVAVARSESLEVPGVGDGVHAAADGGGLRLSSEPPTPAVAATFSLQPSAAYASTSPLSPGRFKLELTLGQEAYDQLEQLRELLRHQNPRGEITCIVERALRELLERTLKQRFAQTASPRPRCAPAPEAGSDASVADACESQSDRALDAAALSDASLAAGRQQPAARTLEVSRAGTDVLDEAPSAAKSRYVPRGVLRAIYARDAGRCSYVSADGRRCSARGFLEVHHHRAFALGGPATVGNLRLVCRAHNFWLAERELGCGFVAAKVVRAGARVRSQSGIDASTT
jgi:hypothetical protein